MLVDPELMRYIAGPEAEGLYASSLDDINFAKFSKNLRSKKSQVVIDRLLRAKRMGREALLFRSDLITLKNPAVRSLVKHEYFHFTHDIFNRVISSGDKSRAFDMSLYLQSKGVRFYDPLYSAIKKVTAGSNALEEYMAYTLTGADNPLFVKNFRDPLSKALGELPVYRDVFSKSGNLSFTAMKKVIAERSREALSLNAARNDGGVSFSRRVCRAMINQKSTMSKVGTATSKAINVLKRIIPR